MESKLCCAIAFVKAVTIVLAPLNEVTRSIRWKRLRESKPNPYIENKDGRTPIILKGKRPGSDREIEICRLYKRRRNCHFLEVWRRDVGLATV